MSKKHRRLAFLIGIFVTVISVVFDLDYADIASEGLTLSSIVLAVYVAAMMGLIGSTLGKKLASTVAEDGEHTQLWVLRQYFQKALIYAGITIIISSIVLLFPDASNENIEGIWQLAYRLFSVIAITVYALNLYYMGITLVFMLNRQIWDA